MTDNIEHASKTVFSLTKEEEAALIKSWHENKDGKALNKIITANIGGVNLIVNQKGWRQWANRVGVDLEDLRSEAHLKMAELARTWTGEKGGFYSYYSVVIERLLKSKLGGADRAVLSEKARYALWKLHSFTQADQLGKEIEMWTDSDIKYVAQQMKTSEGVVRAARDHWMRGGDVSLDANVGDDQEMTRGEVVSRTPDIEGLETSAPWFGATTHDMLEWKEGEDERKAVGRLDLSWAREQLREWIQLLPQAERMTILYRYVMPSALTREGEWRNEVPYDKVANQINSLRGLSATADDVEQWDRLARMRLEAFVRGDFSLADPKEKSDVDTWNKLRSAREQAGENWEMWMMLLPEEERSILFYRWFYWEHDPGQMPRAFKDICQKEERKVSSKKGPSWSLFITPEVGREREESALRHVAEFVSGNFSSADYRRMMRTLSKKRPDLAEAFADSLPEKSLEKQLFFHRFQKRKEMTLKDKYITSAPSMSLGAKRFHDKIVGRKGREVAREESKQILEERGKNLAQKLFAFIGKKLTQK